MVYIARLSSARRIESKVNINQICLWAGLGLHSRQADYRWLKIKLNIRQICLLGGFGFVQQRRPPGLKSSQYKPNLSLSRVLVLHSRQSRVAEIKTECKPNLSLSRVLVYIPIIHKSSARWESESEFACKGKIRFERQICRAPRFHY